MLTIEDVLTYRKFPDGIAASHYPIDVHGVDDVSLGLKYQHDVPVDEQYWEVPFRVMIPKTLDNVLTAGRCAGMDFPCAVRRTPSNPPAAPWVRPRASPPQWP